MDTETLTTLATLQAAMVALQSRTGDDTLAHTVERGRYRLQRVVYAQRNRRGMPCGRPTITPLTDWAPLAQHLDNLRAFGEG